MSQSKESLHFLILAQGQRRRILAGSCYRVIVQRIKDPCGVGMWIQGRKRITEKKKTSGKKAKGKYHRRLSVFWKKFFFEALKTFVTASPHSIFS